MADDPLTPLNLGALDPTRDAGFDAMARSLAERAMRARLRPRDLVTDLLSWSRPALAAAAVIAVVAIPALARLRPPAPPDARGLAQAPAPGNVLGVPDPIIALTRSPNGASVMELVAAFDQAGVSSGH